MKIVLPVFYSLLLSLLLLTMLSAQSSHRTVSGHTAISGGAGMKQYPRINSAENPKAQLPDEFTVSQNYPNPFNGSTSIKISLPAFSPNGLCEFRLYNIIGSLLYSETFSVNRSFIYKLSTDRLNLPSGTYIYKVQGQGTVVTKKLTLMK